MAQKRKLIGEYLIEKGIINEKQLAEAVEEHLKTHQRIGDILTRRGFAKEEDIAKALSEQLGVPFIDVLTYRFDPASVALVSYETAKRLQAVPLYKISDTLTVAMVNPLDVEAIDELERSTHLRINPVFALPSGINAAIDKYYGLKSGYVEHKYSSGTGGMGAGTKPSEQEIPKLIEEATQAPVIKLVNRVILDAVKARASDIHLEPQEKGFYCRTRIDGILQDFMPLPAELRSAVISRIKIMADMDIAEKRLPQDGRVQLNIEGNSIDLRIATFPTIYGEHAAIRILDKSTGILKLEELGLTGEHLESFRSVVTRPFGMILVTGPTGSGKTTTLYSVLNAIRDTRKNIITLEDPVEYSIERIHQSQVNVKAGLGFANGLRSIVRMDPDVIMIGEIRDKETAEIAVHAALTGHLVFSTLHTNDAPSAYARLIDIGVEPYLVASSVKAVLAQRLIRKLCLGCRKNYQPTQEELMIFKEAGADKLAKAVFYKEVGCKECRSSGFKGRTGIYELLLPTDNLRNLIMKKTPAHLLMEEARNSGMRTLNEDGLDKVREGITAVSEILRVTERA